MNSYLTSDFLEMLRFNDGDKVAILCPDKVRLGYPLDCSDDQIIVCNPDDPAVHEHICPVYLMTYDPLIVLGAEQIFS